MGGWNALGFSAGVVPTKRPPRGTGGTRSGGESGTRRGRSRSPRENARLRPLPRQLRKGCAGIGRLRLRTPQLDSLVWCCVVRGVFTVPSPWADPLDGGAPPAMLRRVAVACGKRIELDFLPGEKIVVTLDDTFKEAVGKIDNMSERGEVHEKSYHAKRFYANMKSSIEMRMRVAGDEMSDFENNSDAFSNFSDLLHYKDTVTTRPSEAALDATLATYKPVYQPDDADAPAHAMVRSVFASLGARAAKRARVRTDGMLADAMAVWSMDGLSKKQRLKSWRRQRLSLKSWLHLPKGLGDVPVWRFEPEVYARRVRADASDFKAWISKGSLKRLKAARVSARVRRKMIYEATERSLMQWAAPSGAELLATRSGGSYEAAVRMVRPNGSMDPLLAARPADVVLGDLTRRGLRLMDGPLCSLLTAMSGAITATHKAEEKEVHLRKVQECYRVMCQRHRPGPRTHSVAVTLLARNHRAHTAFALIEEQLAAGIKVDPRSFTTVMAQSMRAMSDKAAAARLIERAWTCMKEQGVAADAKCWAVRIEALCRLHSFGAGVQGYREALAEERAQQRPLYFDEGLYAAFLRSGVPAAGVAVWSELRRRQVPRGFDALCAWLACCEHHGDLDTAVVAGTLAAEDGIPPWRAVLEVALRLGEEDALGPLLVLYGAEADPSPGRHLLEGLLTAVGSLPHDITPYPAAECLTPYPPQGLLPPPRPP